MKRLSMFLSCTFAIALTSSVGSAATVVFSSSLDDLTGLAIVGSADSAGAAGYDYSADGIPEAPNSVGGAATTGLKLEANIVAPTGGEQTAAVTTGLSLSGQYTVQAEVWVNANGPFPDGGAGSTEFAGVAVGHDGVTAGRNGASLVYDGEGGSSRDYRLYRDVNEQGFSTGQYATDSNNNAGVDYVAAFPGLGAPASQSQTGTTNDGSGGFQWMTLLVEVDTDALGVSGLTGDLGTATFTLTSADSGNTVVAGTIDNSNNLDGGAINMSGNVALVYADIFSSVSGNAGLSFGVFDNLVVTTVPEPSSLALLSLSGLALLRRRRR